MTSEERRAGQHRSVIVGVGASLMLALLYMFWHKLLYEDFTSDGSEAYYFSLTTLENGIPHWDLENGQFGFVLNFFLFSYPCAALIQLLGPIEAAVRIPFFFYVLVIYLLSVKLSTPEKTLDGRQSLAIRCAFIALSLFYMSMLFGFYATHNPYTTDLAEPAATDLLLCALLLVAFHCLWKGRYILLSATLIAMAMSQQGGVPWVVILCVSAALFLEEQRKRIALSFAFFSVFWVTASFLHQYYYLEGVQNVFSVQTLAERAIFNIKGSGSSGRWLFLGKYYLLTGGVLVVPCLADIRRVDPFTRTLAAASVLFALSTILFGTHIHYFSGTAYLAPVIFARWAFGAASVRPLPWLGALPVVMIVVLMVCVWPDRSALYRSESALGRRTLFDYPSRREAIAGSDYVTRRIWGSNWARVFPDRYWGPGNWSWVYYSRKSWESIPGRGHAPERLRDVDYVVSNRRREIPGFDLLIHDDVHHLYVRSVDILVGDIKGRPPALLLYPPIIKDAMRRDYGGEYRLRETLEMYSGTREQLRQMPSTPARSKLLAFLERESKRLHRRLSAIVRLQDA